MKFEVLKQSHIKRNIIIGIMIVLIISAIILNFTRAKYRTTQSIPLVNGTINYSPGDIIISAHFNDELLESFPTKDSGYTVGSVTCDNEATATFDEDAWEITVNNLVTKGTKCDVYFEEKISAKDTILANSIVNDGTPDFSEIATTDEGVWTAEDNLGTSYYFRGAVTDNYVKFAGFYWRIIRINGNGSIRMIYDGTTAHANGEDNSDNYTYNGNNHYNNSEDGSYHVGYTYTTAQRPSTQNGGSDSTIKQLLESWYNTNISGNGYDNYVTRNPGFCNDRDVASGYTWSAYNLVRYAAWERLYDNKTPLLKCNNSIDLYTTKVGLITADEVSMAGGGYNMDNKNYYLYSYYDYWTMTPSSSNSIGYAEVMRVTSTGFNSVGVNGNCSIRPVINLSADVTLTGSGTATDPYVVEGAE